jgi:hypothetical protein
MAVTSDEFHSLLKEYEIMFFSETDMSPGEEESANVPNGYVLVSLPRQPRLQNARCGGGVALLIRDNITSPKNLFLGFVFRRNFTANQDVFCPMTSTKHVGIIST